MPTLLLRIVTQGTTIKIESSTITALLVSVKINSTPFGRSTLNQIYSLVELSELVVRSRSISNNFNAVQPQSDMGTIRRKQLFASLSRQYSVTGVNRSDTK